MEYDKERKSRNLESAGRFILWAKGVQWYLSEPVCISPE